MISTTHRPATDLGYLLHKHPERVHEFELPYGRVQVFYPEAADERCTAALVLEVDPLRIARRGFGAASAAPLGAYVNDRPYVASSYLSVAIGKVFGTALNGRSKERPDLVETPIPLTATIEVVPAPDDDVAARLFEPLGYEVRASRLPTESGTASPYIRLEIEQTIRLAELLTHLYVLLPVLDDAKHYYIGDDEVDKLLARGGGWLAAHPEREYIAARYLKHQRSLADDALARLSEEHPSLVDGDDDAEVEPAMPNRTLAELRLDAVLAALREANAKSVVDLGCGEGRLLRALTEDRGFARILGMDVSPRALLAAGRRLHLDDLPERQRDRMRLVQGSLLYRDERLAGFDAAVLSEVIEHVEPDQLPRLERVVFGEARPRTVVVTTPNREFNAAIAGLGDGELRHHDHRFEWSRQEFADWAEGVADRFDYAVEFRGVGEPDSSSGAPTQLAVFRS